MNWGGGGDSILLSELIGKRRLTAGLPNGSNFDNNILHVLQEGRSNIFTFFTCSEREKVLFIYLLISHSDANTQEGWLEGKKKVIFLRISNFETEASVKKEILKHQTTKLSVFSGSLF